MTEMGLSADQIDDMEHEEIDPCVDKFMSRHFPEVKPDSKEYEEEAGIRKYTLHMIKCRMTSVQELLKEGKAFLLPIKIEVEGKHICFKAVFSLVSMLASLLVDFFYIYIISQLFVVISPT